MRVLEKFNFLGKKIKIISIDGGGIRGLYAAYVIKTIEKEFGIKLADYFDVFCGVSTGSLIASMLYYGYTGQEIYETYLETHEDIFKSDWKSIEFFTYKYDNKNIRRVVLDILKETKHIPQVGKQLHILSYNVTDEKSEMFYVDSNVSKEKLADYVTASCSAPHYFPSYFIDNKEYIDGGVITRNPSLIIFNKMIPDKSKINLDNVKLLSIGCIQGKLREKNYYMSILNYALESNTRLYDELLDDILPEGHYCRIDSKLDGYTDISEINDDLKRIIKGYSKVFVEKDKKKLEKLLKE